MRLDFDLSAKLVVREAMSSPVIGVNEGYSVVDAAKVMSEQKIGAIVIYDELEKPVGIVTERDLVYRVIAMGSVPRDVKVGDVMTSPLKMVEAETSLEDAMKMMDRQKIRRLGVSYKGQLEGIITNKDLLRLMPTLIDLVRERSRIQSVDSTTGPSLVGYCSRCEQYSSNLRFIDSELICEDCRAGF